MQILAITDLHGNEPMLETILGRAGKWDLLLFGGDLTNFGTVEQAERIIARCREAGPPVFAVAGNCDSPEIDDRLRELGVSLFGRGVVHAGIGLAGVSAMPPWRGTMYELTEQEIADALSTGHEQLRGAERVVLLCHPPPYDTTVDQTAAGIHVGSTAVREHVAAHQPAAVVCGHIHEARGIDQIGASAIVNCGEARRGYYAELVLGEAVEARLRSISEN